MMAKNGEGVHRCSALIGTKVADAVIEAQNEYDCLTEGAHVPSDVSNVFFLNTHPG